MTVTRIERPVHRRVYRLRARNLKFGVFDETRQGFVGVREKFGELFLDVEYRGQAVYAVEDLGELPSGVGVSDTKKLMTHILRVEDEDRLGGEIPENAVWFEVLGDGYGVDHAFRIGSFVEGMKKLVYHPDGPTLVECFGEVDANTNWCTESQWVRVEHLRPLCDAARVFLESEYW